MTVSRLASRLGTGPLQQAPARKPRISRLDSEPAMALSRTASTWPNMITGGVVGTQRLIGEWSGDHLTRAEPPGKDNCTDQTGALCPRFAEALARQALAELQLTEFNHRLANMLQRLVNRIERQRRMQDDPVRQDELAGLAASVRASAQLHRYLLPPRQDEPVDLGALLGNVAAAIEGVTGLLCDVDVEPANVPSQVAVRLAAAVNELAWNAHKHAYGGVESGVIQIVCRREADARLRLSVADRGCGLPADFDPRASDGLGLMVVCATARQFGGELRVESDGGARFTLLLNIPSFE